jgi:8-oxo-dGTP pyrophosphatase MutT (NUDIX family)
VLGGAATGRKWAPEANEKASLLNHYQTLTTDCLQTSSKLGMESPILIAFDAIDKTYLSPLHVLQEAYPGKRIVAGVAIIASSFINPSLKKLLLLQRSAGENIYPLMYDIPGGGAEPVDQTIIDTVVREAAEETGLVVTKVLRTFDGFEYTTRTGPAVQFNFVVEVEDGMDATVTLNPCEHQAFAWVGHGDDLSQYLITESMGKVVDDALEVSRSM